MPSITVHSTTQHSMAQNTRTGYILQGLGGAGSHPNILRSGCSSSLGKQRVQCRRSAPNSVLLACIRRAPRSSSSKYILVNSSLTTRSMMGTISCRHQSVRRTAPRSAVDEKNEIWPHYAAATASVWRLVAEVSARGTKQLRFFHLRVVNELLV